MSTEHNFDCKLHEVYYEQPNVQYF